MSERDSASPEHDPRPDLGDLFENLPDPTLRLPAVDDSAPAPGTRRAARARRAAAHAEQRAHHTQQAQAEQHADTASAPDPRPQPAAAERADVPLTASGNPDAPAPAAAPAVTSAPASARLEDLFDTRDEHDHEHAGGRRGKRRKGCLIALIVVLAIIGGLAAAGAWAWNTYGDKISDVMGWGPPADWEPGLATGEALVTIHEGDTGHPVSIALHEAGVTRTEDVFYDYLIEENIAVTFYPGVYRLQKKMTAEAALAALRDEGNRLADTVSVAEGSTIGSTLPEIAETLGMPLEELQAAVSDPAAYGVTAPSLEGWLFPAVYEFDPEVTATQVIQRMVDRTRESLAAAGVPDADAQRVLTIASIIQREGRTDDFAKVSRVIQNRLAIDMKLQMDSTAQYGYGTLHDGVVSSSKEALEDDNPWNTYVRTGLPATPIASPNDAAIDAAMHPAEGPWLYFVTVNLDTGETVFSETYEQHQEAIEQWDAWCKANPDGGCS